MEMQYVVVYGAIDDIVESAVRHDLGDVAFDQRKPRIPAKIRSHGVRMEFHAGCLTGLAVFQRVAARDAVVAAYVQNTRGPFDVVCYASCASKASPEVPLMIPGIRCRGG